MTRLKDEEFLQFAPDTVGVRQRINHSSSACDGDSQSLSIWRNEDGTVGAKCYRCGATGRAGSKPSMFQKVTKTKDLQAPPEDVLSQYEDMPPEVATYLHAKGITEAIAYHYGIGWSESADGLIFPVHNKVYHDGFQVKYFGRKQRYSTVHMGQKQLMFTHLYDGLSAVIIVEDLLSAVRIKEATNVFDSFALLGSELNDQGLAQLVKNHDHFVVWLDNDNSIVCGKAKALYNRLSLFGRCRYIKEQVEPKDISNDEIRGILTARR